MSLWRLLLILVTSTLHASHPINTGSRADMPPRLRQKVMGSGCSFPSGADGWHKTRPQSSVSKVMRAPAGSSGVISMTALHRCAAVSVCEPSALSSLLQLQRGWLAGLRAPGAPAPCFRGSTHVVRAVL